MKKYLIILFVGLNRFVICSQFFHEDVDLENENNFLNGLRDILVAIPLSEVTLAIDYEFKLPYNLQIYNLETKMINNLHNAQIMTNSFNITSILNRKQYFSWLTQASQAHMQITSLCFAPWVNILRFLRIIKRLDLVQRRLLYIFWVNQWPPDNTFERRYMIEALRVLFIHQPRNNTLTLYYNQISPNSQIKLVNWWSSTKLLYNYPLLPKAKEVYKDFQGRVFQIPVLHKPPWHFVENYTDFIRVDGGRDDRLLQVLSERLNFKYEYYDPPDRSQGLAFSSYREFQGVLGMIWRREAEFFIGDVTITYERNRAIEFSFLTLADSGAFVTQTPRRLNEALALIRPFHWKVWPLVIATMLACGPALYLVIATPQSIRKKHTQLNNIKLKSSNQLFWDCIWFNISIFLRQSAREPGSGHRARFLTTLFLLSATYIIGDIYSANLTSLLAKPNREPPIRNLEQLEHAMKFKNYQLLVEQESSSYGILENGTGVFERIWELMSRQRRYVIKSVEAGMRLVKNNHQIALLGGRETLYFETKRFGANHYQLSEKLYTKYSAIAFQKGTPFLENFNIILMNLFEAGIVSKMTEDEYESLGKKIKLSEKKITSSDGSENEYPADPLDAEVQAKKSQDNNDDELHPMSTKMLQGAFFVLVFGYIVSLLSLCIELLYFHRYRYQCLWCQIHFSKIQLLMRRISKIIKRKLILIWNQFIDPFRENIEYYP